ncbi:hypothetical protein [Profundibacter sp.]
MAQRITRIHLIFGATGAGKSTYSAALAQNIRWAGVQKCNLEQAETFQFGLTRDMFDFTESIWEPPSDAEMTRMSGKVVTR